MNEVNRSNDRQQFFTGDHYSAVVVKIIGKNKTFSKLSFS